jgi:hypothetical protein
MPISHSVVGKQKQGLTEERPAWELEINFHNEIIFNFISKVLIFR